MSQYTIRTLNQSAAIRNGEFNIYTGKFESGPPASSKYYLPKQNISTVYSFNNKYYTYSNKLNAVDNSFKSLFLPENYADIFNNKNLILIATNFNFQLSEQNNQRIYSVSCSDNPGCMGIGITSFFIQPSYDANSSNYEINGSMGISFDPIIDSNPVDDYLELNIIRQSETIVRIIYDKAYINTEICIKHPLIDNYLLHTLKPESSSTEWSSVL